MITPTTTNRIRVLDVARGLAIMGILLANISSFAGPAITGMFATEPLPLLPGEAQFESVLMAFVNGKFRSMLAILFGVGLWLQFRKRELIPKAWPGGYVKRMAWLFAIGLVHGYLIWYGDILASYAVVAVVAAFMVKIKDKTMWWIIALLAANALFTALLSFGSSAYFASSPSSGDWDLGSVWPIFSQQGEIAAFQTGSYLDQLVSRLVFYSIMLGSVLVLGFILLPLFLLGVMFARMGFLSRPSQFPRVRLWCLITGFGVGMPLSMVGFLPMSQKIASAYQQGIIELFAGPLQSIGYLTLIAMIVEAGWLRPVGAIFERVGRVALSAYLLQSIVCTFIFYSWGLGYFARLEPSQWMMVVLLVWVIDILFAYLWLSWFRMGPVEWLWRSLTESRVLPIRRTLEPEAPPIQPSEAA